MVLLSHVSTQPQIQTHYYVKYNMQSQNLKPYNLAIQHTENVYGARSTFHQLQSVDAQKKKFSLRAILPPKQFSKSHHPSQMKPSIVSETLEVQLQLCEEMNLNNCTEIIFLPIGMKIKPQDNHFVATTYSLCKKGVTRGWSPLLLPPMVCLQTMATGEGLVLGNAMLPYFWKGKRVTTQRAL